MKTAKKITTLPGRNARVMGPHSVRVTRTYDAKPEKIFRAWTDPTSIGAWLANGEYSTADVRVGGLFYIQMRALEKINPHYGRYLRIDSPRALEFTWVSEWTMGKESAVLIELAVKKGGTELTLTHDGLPNEILAEAHSAGWSSFLEELNSRL
ncbi:SRPBCC domain-containing protein [Rudaea sp.]|uniref:SRPBCC domain-containing protein n=1 Tax=Rudaea sp. TaxID=2136325 RepID=UPI0037848179